MGIDNDLSVLGRARGDVGECPGGFKLKHWCTMLEELDESWHDTTLDNPLDRWVFLF